MNVLIIVFIMLQVLTIVTYHRLSTYVQSSGLRIEYAQYMSKYEREGINQAEQKRYKNAKETIGNKSTSDKANGLINLQPFGDLPKREKEDVGDPGLTPLAEVTADILKRLLDILYREKPFYKSAKERYPSLNEAIVKQLLRGVVLKPCDSKWKEKTELANIPFQDPELREIFVNMLEGSESSPGDPDSGFPSLYDYVTIKGKDTINLVSAKEPVLRSVYRDGSTVEYFMEARKKLRAQVKGQYMEKAAAEKELRSLYGGANHLLIDPNLVQFKF